MQMLTNGGDTEGLFRAAFMSSGGAIPSGSVEHGAHRVPIVLVDSILTMKTVQDRWDSFATIAGCGDFLGSASVFDCLRKVSLEAIRAGQDASGSIFGYYGLDVA